MSQVSSRVAETRDDDKGDGDESNDIIRDFRFEPVNGDDSRKMTASASWRANNEITEEEDEETTIASSSHNNHGGNSHSSAWGLTAISEIQTTSLFSIDINNLRSSGSSDSNVVYVAVGKSESSSDALLWALKHALSPGIATTVVYLVHIFSEIKYIPSPMGGGWVPRSQVNRELVESYVAQESNKRRQLLSKYADTCTTHLVQVETILIESDSVVDAIVELISVLNIPKLILGISKSNLRKVKAGKLSGSIVADQVLQRAPPECEVKIICQGKDIMATSDQSLNNSKSTSPTTAANHTGTPQAPDEHPPNSINSFSCCFRPSTNVD